MNPDSVNPDSVNPDNMNPDSVNPDNMNPDEAPLDRDDPLLAWGLSERLGGEVPPDLVAGVQAKLRLGEPSIAPTRRPTPRWLAVALVLLGTSVVLGVAWWPRAPVAPARQEPVSRPPLVRIGSLAEAQALPVGTRGVEADGVDDAVIEALTRLCELEELVVREPWNESFWMSLKMTPPKDPRHITPASWRHFASFSKLRWLTLSGTVLVARVGTGTPADAEVVAALERLPLLESLTMRCLLTSDQVVARLPLLRNLRELDLSFNHGFQAEGLEAVLHCRSLRQLSLRGCQQLRGEGLARLHELPELEQLDVSLIDGLNWWSGTGVLDDTEVQIMERARGLVGGLGFGVNDQALAGIAKTAKLRVLDIGSGRWTRTGLGELGNCATLQELRMFGGNDPSPAFVGDLPLGLLRLEVCGDYTDAFCVAVRQHLTRLQHLSVAACYRITDRGLGELLAMPSLRSLDMGQMYGLTAACVDRLALATQLEQLDLRNNAWVTAEHVQRLRRALPKLGTVETSLSEEELRAVKPR